MIFFTNIIEHVIIVSVIDEAMKSVRAKVAKQ